MSFTKKLTSVILSLCMVLSLATVAIVPAAAETTVETYAQDTIQGSNILHCFDWSYNNIKANLPDIAKAGYTAVQTSPVQSPKDYNASWTDGSGQWWKLYQPLGFSVSNNTWLGTKDELTSLCAEAEKYNIKVVVDIVANHLANNGAEGGTYDYVNSGIESQLKGSQYFHNNNTRTNDDTRYNITQYHLGMPDLNTGNSTVQQRALDLLKECIDCGVDGFRFDAAKHIETPYDDGSYNSDFWPVVINGAKDYASTKGEDTPFFYGEILGNAGPYFDISNYTTYMAVTDNYTGDLALDNAYYSWAPDLADSTYYKGASAADSVLWVESHDTYMGESGSAGLKNTSSVESNIINRAWAIIGARADSTALFFARPNTVMGYASTDGNWKSTAVAEVNKFKNHFDGTREYISSSGNNVAYIERGKKGVVISKLDGGGQVSLTAHTMEDGTYKDYVSGGTFTVSNGVISGNVDSQGVAVVYNAEDSVVNYIEADTLYLNPSLNNWKQGNERYAMYVFNSTGNAWVSMTDSNNDGIYEADVPNGNWTGVIFCRMNGSTTDNNWDNKWYQTGDVIPYDGDNLFTVTGRNGNDDNNYFGSWNVYSTCTEHTYGTPVWTWASDYSSATAQFTCSVCSDKQTVNAVITSNTENNAITYTATATFNNQTYTDSKQKTVEDDTDTYTIYVTDNAGWNSVNVYYWDNGKTWPGEAATQYSGNNCYTYKIPKNTSGVIFNNNNKGKQTVDITTGIKDGAHWIISNTQTDGKYNVSTAPSYYLIGSINGWDTNNTDYAFNLENTTDSCKVQYKLSGVQLTAEAELKVIDSNKKWYPDPGSNYTVSETGTYDIYFRPYSDGNEDWHASCLYLYKINPKYTVTWKNYDGTVLETDENVEQGTTPSYDGKTPEKPASVDTAYTFTGWSPEISAVSGDITYTAQFSSEARKYTVTWKNDDGTILKTDSVAYGTTPEYSGDALIKEATLSKSYSFSGWTPAVAPVTGDAEYTATYSEMPVSTYNVSVTNAIGWDDVYVYYWKGSEDNTWPGENIKSVGENFNLTAQISSTAEGVIFSNGKEGTEKQQTENITSIKNGAHWAVSLHDNKVTVNEVPTYYLAGTFTDPQWNKDYSPVFSPVKNKDGFEEYKLSGVQLTAGTELKVIDSNGVWFPSDNVNYTVTADGTYDVYFRRNADGDDGWFYNYFSLTNVTPYTITWVDGNGEVVETDTVIHGETPSYNGTTPVKNSDEQYTYTFTGWSPEITPATADATYTAVFDQSVNTYNVIWQNYDGTELDTEVYEYGVLPTYKGEIPTKASSEMYDYTFAGWTPTVDTVTREITYTAVYDETFRTYTVTFKNWNGDTLYTQEFTYNAYPDYQGETPTKPSDTEHDYLFEGQWSPTLAPVTDDVTYTAQFTEYPRMYHITWYNDDGGTILWETDVPYGMTPEYFGQNPTKMDNEQYHYEFSGWTPDVQPVTGDASYTAQYNEILNTYPVTWRNEDGMLLGQTFVEYGALPVYTGTPEKSADEFYHYNFTGWTPELTPVTGPVEFTAVFTPQPHQFDEPYSVWSTDYQNVEITYHCNDCGYEAHHFVNHTDFAVDIEPKCETSGSGHYYVRDRFGSYDYEIRSEQIEIPAHGHHYGEPVWNWTEDGSSATATFTCTECGNTRTEAANIETTSYSAPGCDYQGSANYRAVVNLDGAVYEDTHGVIIPATGHSWGQPTWSWSFDRQFATATFECANCHLKNSYTDNNVQVEYSSEKTTRTATVFFYGDYYTNTIEEEPVQFNINWFSEGSLIKTDSVTYGTTPVYVGETPTKAADPASHYTFTGWQPEIQPAYSNADYYAVFTPESHQYSEPYSVDWNIDSKYVEITYRCSVCGHEEIHRVILSEYNFVVDTPSTCTVQGTGHYHVNDMNVSVDSDPVAIPVTDHSYGQPEWSWADDYKSATATFTCGICGDVQCVTTTDVAIDYQNDKTVYTAKAVFNGIEYRNTAEADAKLFAGHSLTLNKNNDGDIGVNFFINVSEADVDRGVTVNFEWTVNGNTKRSSYKLDKAKDFVTDHRYKASCFVAAAEMTYDIKATVTIGDELHEETNIYSVKRYADKILETSTDEKLITLIQAMLDYGTRAQIAFDRTQPGLANGGTYYLTYNVNASDISGVEDDMREKLSDYGLEYVGSTIVYLTKSTLRHYYKVSDADTFNNYKESITMDGAAVSFSKNGDMIYCDVKNIGAYELDTVHTLKIGDTDYDYSVLTYLKKSIASEKTSDNTKELCKATYRYYVAAKAYFG